MTLAAMFVLLVLIVVVAIKRRTTTRPIQLRPARAPSVRPSHVSSAARVLARGSSPPFRPDQASSDQLPVFRPRSEEEDTAQLQVFQPRSKAPEESATVIVDHDQLYGPR